MKNLKLKKIDFAGAKALSREEMKKVMGGIISPETLLKMCAEELAREVASVEEDEALAQIVFETGMNGCIDIYEGMIRPNTIPGHYN